MGEAIRLWPDRAPGSPAQPAAVENAVPEGRSEPGDYPTLTPYLLDTTEPRSMVLVLPGGGYGYQAPHEAEPVAKLFNEAGLHAAVLAYRVGPRHRHPAMLQDAQRAIRIIRSQAGAWNLRRSPKGTAFVGALGFSAGGHLTSTLAVHHDRFVCDQDDLAATQPARPDAVALCYPVIDLQEFAHHGSLNNLLGPTPDPAMVRELSSHRHVGPDSPPAFLWHTADDGAVSVQNSLLYFAACRKHEVRAELHVYESGHHGMGLATNHRAIGTWGSLACHFFQRHLS